MLTAIILYGSASGQASKNLGIFEKAYDVLLALIFAGLVEGL